MLKLNLTDGASLLERRRSPAATRCAAARAHPAHVQQRCPGAQARCTSRAWSTAASPPCSTRSPRAPRRAGAPSRRCSDPASSTVQAWVCERSPPTVQTLALDCASDPVAASAGRARQTGRRRRGAQVAVTDAPVRRGVLLLRAENVAVLGGQARPALPPASGARRASPACQLQPPPGKQLRARRSQHLFHVVAADCGSKTHQRAPACSAGAYAPVRAPEPSPSQSAAAPAPGRAPGGRAAARAGALAAAAGRAQRARARGRRARPVRGGGRGGLGRARAARPARGVPRSRRSERSMVRLGASRMPGFLRALTHHAWLVSGVPLQCAHLSGPSACAAHQRTSLA